MNLKYFAVFLLVFLLSISPANSKGAGDGSKSDLLRQVDRGTGTGRHTDCSSSSRYIASECISHEFNASQSGRKFGCTQYLDCKKIAKRLGITNNVGCAKKSGYSECITCNVSSYYQKHGFTVYGCGSGANSVWVIVAVAFGMVVGLIIGLSCLFCTFCPFHKYRMAARQNRQVQPGPPPGSRGQGGQGYGRYPGRPRGAGQPQMSRQGNLVGPPASPNTPLLPRQVQGQGQYPGSSPNPSTIVNPKSSTDSEAEELSVSEFISKKGEKSKSSKKTKSNRKKGKGKNSPKK